MTTITGDDIVTITDYFGAAWPWAEWSEETMAVWIDGLGDERFPLERDVALETARLLTRKRDRPPSMADFLTEYRLELARRDPGRLALNSAPVDREARRRLVAELKAAMTPRHHDHRHGWEGCATCVASVERYGLSPPPSKPAEVHP